MNKKEWIVIETGITNARSQNGNAVPRLLLGGNVVVDGKRDLVVSATALGGLLSVVSAATLNHGSPVVSATTLSVVATAAFLRSSNASGGVVSASSNGHCECDCWDDKSKEINGGGWDGWAGLGLLVGAVFLRKRWISQK